MSALKINKNELEALMSGEKKLLLDFYAGWCGPCKMMGPIIDEIAEDRPDIVVGKINVEEEVELASKFGVFSIPTLVVMENGEIINKSSGFRPKAQVLAMLEG